MIFQPSPLYPRWAVVIFNPANDINRLTYSYARIHNLWMMASLDNGWNNRNVVPTENTIFEHTELIRSDQCLLVASVSDTRTEWGSCWVPFNCRNQKSNGAPPAMLTIMRWDIIFIIRSPPPSMRCFSIIATCTFLQGSTDLVRDLRHLENSVVLDSRSMPQIMLDARVSWRPQTVR